MFCCKHWTLARIIQKQEEDASGMTMHTARQTMISEHTPRIQLVYVPIGNYSYKTQQGLAERQLRKRLEKQGWTVWRGGNFNLLRQQNNAYPSVRKAYEKLFQKIVVSHGAPMLERLQYICSVHHGMPDFICWRRGQWKFVECKRGHEQLSARQKTCVRILQEMGFAIEVHKLVDPCTKTRDALVSFETGAKYVLAKDLVLRKYMK